MEVDWAAAALDDPERAREFIAEDRPHADDEFVERLLEAIDTVLEFPNLGRAGRVEGTREFVIAGSPWLLVYRVREDRVQIARLVHHARRWPPA